jgi:hypothetical protein
MQSKGLRAQRSSGSNPWQSGEAFFPEDLPGARLKQFLVSHLPHAFAQHHLFGPAQAMPDPKSNFSP